MADAVDDFLTGKTGAGSDAPAAVKMDATDAFLTGGDATTTKAKAGETAELFRPSTWHVPQDPAAQAVRNAISDPRTALQPAPNTTYGDIVPLARDEQTGELRFAMPNMLRAPLQGLIGGVGSEALTIDPVTNQVRLTPEAQAAGSLGPGIGGRDLRFSGASPLQFVPPTGTFDRKAPIPPDTAVNLLSPDARVRAAETPAGPSSSTGIEPPPPSGVRPPTSAVPAAGDSPLSPTAAPSARITPIITQAQAEAEADRIIRHFAGGQTPVINPAPLASGAQPTLSQSIEGGHGGLAGLERGVRDVPEQTQHFVTRETGNTALRNKAVTDVIGDSRATDVVEAELNNRTRPQEKAIFDSARTKPVDTSEAIAALDQILNGPQGQRDVVRSSLLQLRDKLIDKNGKMQTDAAQLRGVDLSIGDQISPKAAGTAHDGRAAAHELMVVRDALRDSIEQGAPGYKDFLAQQAAERSAIDGQRFLQARNITDRQGNVNLGTLDSTIKAAESQQQKPGARLADGVTDEQLARLKELRADYQHDAKQRLGTSIGSPTVQKLGVSGSMGVMGHPLLAGGAGVAGLWAAGATNPLLGAVLGGAGYLMKQQSLKGQRMVMDALRDKLLNPEKARSAFKNGGQR